MTACVHRGQSAPGLTHPARILQVADVYQALTQLRPYRPARTADAPAAR
jgi:HD-GYP domain-containing protein (c-di-GMP phosphodiesterase class II)